MMMTLQSGWNEIAVTNDDNVGAVFGAVAKGALMDATINAITNIADNNLDNFFISLLLSTTMYL